jgi:hypothetical protein
MSEETKGISDAPEQSASSVAQEAKEQTTQTVESLSESKDKVAYETYRRTLTEAKKAKARLQELEDENLKMRQSQLEAEGKKDELIEALRKQNAEIQGKLKNAVGSFAYKSVSSEIMDEANKMGCSSLNLLMKAVESDLKTLEYDDDFKVNRDQVKELLERVKKDEPVLFSKKAPTVKDGIPATPKLNEETDIGKMSLEDRINALSRLDRTGKI